MANPVQRLRYFDGEYLRSYDFTDEQSYHIAMRRLMNLKLHLHGIVYGMRIVEDQDSVSGGPYFFSIAPGLAIDQTGREILVPAPYSLTNVLNGPGLSPGSYEVWICYQENETGLPAAGYLDCNVQNQNTRWQEGFLVQLKPIKGPSLFKECGGVRLGIVKLIHGTLGGLEIAFPVYNTERMYVGIRAQRIIAPDEEKDTFDITALTTPVPDALLPGYLDVHPGLFNRGNAVVKKNLVVGDDFVLDSTTVGGANLPNPVPPTGNVKITQDLFLNGDFYGLVGGTWYKLKDYIQTLMPNTVIGTTTFTIPPGTKTTDTALPVAIQTTLPNVTQTSVSLAITQTVWQPEAVLQSWAGTPGPITIGVSLASLTNTGGPSYNLAIQWTASPSHNFGVGDDRLPITQLTVSFVVVFSP